jgi:hypothetical protein
MTSVLVMTTVPRRTMPRTTVMFSAGVQVHL